MAERVMRHKGYFRGDGNGLSGGVCKVVYNF